MTTPADHDKRCHAACDTSVKCNCGAQPNNCPAGPAGPPGAPGEAGLDGDKGVDGNAGGVFVPVNNGYEQVFLSTASNLKQVPEPGVLALLGIGMIGLWGGTLRRRG